MVSPFAIFTSFHCLKRDLILFYISINSNYDLFTRSTTDVCCKEGS